MTIVIAAGGTGGHLYPAIAVAREFLQRDPATKILFVGTTRGIEGKVLAHEGFPLHCIAAKPLMGKSPVEILKALAAVPVSLWQSLGILKAQRADLVFGVGGYTSPAMLLAAFLRKIPGVILEPNAYPGMANKAVAPLVQRIFLAFESTLQFFDRRRARVVGTPVRRDFLQRDEPDHRTMETAAAKRLLIFGGSQGAKAINSAVIDALPRLKALNQALAITHQTGEADLARVKAAYEAAGLSAQISPFLFDMPTALQAADLVISRSGAMTIAELNASGTPAILIPLPTAIYNHQLRNAEVMVQAGGAVLLSQGELTGGTLAQTVTDILCDPQRLATMSRCSWNMRRSDAAETIVRECYDLIRRRHETSGGTP
ncbi:MAG: UDP-N-acetylglucosamine--N-acetylmuramyl-(pentapeptide) pyrophosphoryl-undecaprenol N-acetylglucosamine transferase [Nitrospirae bacterium]|nr:UDP-N-acetylglucosamine--N-acetylmuramyl-(pentapeptide) pyrophosphoryl-undecaprenol N-acetylglucosamine transferase [Nitrospirota bacterium]MCE7966045.1 undecaprenyldiphospho-muramoylpentapeptide beta-N-acetylglucosaminyltransferase [Nitrospira sp. NTP2]MCK6493593.1 undecaprenyldiphospho-muramoylpentapeptide beta-N-acetylglucosaminyltransferase [Nitrospira sp.]MEB2339001.1 undecaprenyldiphospho-muramoylpentapeptide beta-N-acetylglucosaminyltransferase [Nitrospirales bacterium]MCK6498006.1 un